MIPFFKRAITVPKTILLIEADENLREFFTRVFIIDGFEVLFLDCEEDILKLSKDEVQSLDVLVVDDCKDASAFAQLLDDIYSTHERSRKLPVLAILTKGSNADSYHDHFDAVMIKDNFNIQLLTTLVEKFSNP